MKQSRPLSENPDRVEENESMGEETTLPKTFVFGRRKGKPLSPNQQDMMDSFLPQIRLNPVKPVGDPKTLFIHDPKQIWMEIGFGGGEHLIGQAQDNPEIGLIGCEPFVNGVVKALAAIRDNQIKTIRLYDEDATHILDWLPENSLDRLFLLYPDPWHKKRHWKRRFVSPANLDRMARVMKSGAIFRFASDIDSYISWTLDHVQRQGAFVELSKTPQDRLVPWSDWRQTRYEQKAIREGRTPHYLTFCRN